ncbi:MAG: polymer-forming cytoskeletal protein, partial [Flavobacteriales bacterium]
MKWILSILICSSMSYASAQSLYINGSKKGEIESDGDVYINGSKKGYIEGDGDVYVNGSKKGYIEN